MNLSMWRKALTVIPRLDSAEWQRLDLISRWLIASRAAVLLLTFFPCLIAGLLAYRDGGLGPGGFRFGLWLPLTLGLLLAHAANNLLNDITDYQRGVDRDNYFRAQYGPQPLEHGLLTLRQMWLYAGLTGLLALAAGLYLISARGGLTVWFLAAGAFFVLFYTWPLKYIGLGEIAVVLVWGPLMIGGGYYVITGHWSNQVALASLPYALGATSVLFGKHIDKFDSDKARHIHTLPVLLGQRNARYVALGLMAGQYLAVIYLTLTGYFHGVMLLTLVGLTLAPQVIAMYRQPRPAAPPADYPPDIWPLWYSAMAFYHNRRYGTWLMVGLLLDVIWRRVA